MHEVETSRANKQDDSHVRQGKHEKSGPERRYDLMCSLVARVAQFDVAVRKFLPELQSSSQRLFEGPIFSFRLSVHFDDIAFMSVVSGEVASHENHQTLPPEPSH
jgi:hypothetical protein